MAKNTASYPMKLQAPSPSARKTSLIPRYTKLFTQAAALLAGQPLGTTVLVTEFTTEYGARNVAKDIVAGKVKIAPAPAGLVWEIEDYIEERVVDGEVKTISCLYAKLSADES
jgi:hypothetical protein